MLKLAKQSKPTPQMRVWPEISRRHVKGTHLNLKNMNKWEVSSRRLQKLITKPIAIVTDTKK